MRKIVFVIFLILFVSFSSCSFIPKIKDLQLKNDSTLYAGEGEICENQFIKINCSKNLRCEVLTTKPYITKICSKNSVKKHNDFIYRHLYDNDSEYYRAILNSS